jgi:hypothetical protein
MMAICGCNAVLSKRAPNEVTDTYLGLLYPTEEYKIYGYYLVFLLLHQFIWLQLTALACCRYITNTNVKFMLVVDDISAKEEALGKVGVLLVLVSVTCAAAQQHCTLLRSHLDLHAVLPGFQATAQHICGCCLKSILHVRASFEQQSL